MSLDMHDYPYAARVYWWLTCSLGAVVLVAAALQVAGFPNPTILQIAFGATLAAFAGVYAVRVPGTKISGSAAELVMFLLLLESGPAAAAIAAAAEAGTVSWRTSKRWTSPIGSPTIAALAMYACGTGFQLALSAVDPAHSAEATALLLLALAPVYFAANTLLMAVLIKLKLGLPPRPLSILREHAWLALIYAASASLAGLLHMALNTFGWIVLVAIGPVIAVFVSILHIYFKRVEDRAQMQAERIAAAEREAAEAARHLVELKESESRFQSAFAHAAVGMLLVATDGRILQANMALLRLLDYSEEGLLRCDLKELFHPGDVDALEADLRSLLNGAENAFVVELRCRQRRGFDVYVSVSGSLFTVKPPLERCIVLLLQDITARRRAESRLQHVADHDSLTNLPNRNFFMTQLAHAIESVAKHPARRYAVLFLDFDRFKLVNDSLGHGTGDSLLQGIAERLRNFLRSSDVVARFGGDEFAILVQHPNADEEAVSLAERLQDVISEPLFLKGIGISTTASIGITSSLYGYDTPEQVVRDADTAMYRAKSQGKARFAVFDRDLHAEVAHRLWLEGQLRRALDHEHLELVYQPIFDLRTLTLRGFEALVRWTHSEKGAISPESFIRIAEETGLIIPLGTWVMQSACRTLGHWRKTKSGLGPIKMHVNVSGVQLAQPDFPLLVRQAIRGTEIEAHQLVVELTESVLIEKRSVAIPHLEELRDLGVGVSIDDFGTGYSSFSMLHKLPIDEIKIDRSFVEQLGSEGGDAVVATIVALGTTLDKVIIAEGIETATQLARLTATGCAQGQGFLLGRPVPSDQVSPYVSTARANSGHCVELA